MKYFFAFFNKPNVRLLCTWLGFTWARFCVFFITFWWLDNHKIFQLLGVCLFVLFEIFVSLPSQRQLKLSRKFDYWCTLISYTIAYLSAGITYCYIPV